MGIQNTPSTTRHGISGGKPVKRVYQRWAMLFAAHTLLLFFTSSPAKAELLDDVRMNKSSSGEDAVVSFSVPIQYLRHFPRGKSNSVSIYFNVLGNVPRDQWQNYEAFRSPPSDIVTRFTITTRDLNTGPKVIVEFDRPAQYSVSQGRDGQSILIHIKADKPQQKTEPEAKAPAVTVPVPVPSVPVPIVTLPAKTAAAPVVAATPVKPPAPTPAKVVEQAPEPVPAPEPLPVVSPAKTKPAAPQQIVVPKQNAQLGGKDGLPPFPRIDPYAAIPEGVVLPDPATAEERLQRSNNQAAPHMVSGRDALLAGQMFGAVTELNKVLDLPPNKYSADAQLWIGIARERSGQQLKARAEYELYLKLYPDGAQKDWVKARLARLAPPPAPAKPAPVRPPATDFKMSEYGSLSMYYYHGSSQIDTVRTVGTVETPVTLSTTDQSSLITNVNVTARAFNNEYDNRLVIQDLYSANFLKDKDNTNRLNSAYYELRARYDNYSARIGRQSALGGGVLGRFDGLSGGYGFLQNWRINAAAGRLSDYSLESKPTFVSGSLDFGLNDPLGGSVYYIKQKANGLTDRKATGGYLRYFEQGMTGMMMLDYDLQFREMNILSLQGTLNREDGIDFNFLLDRRRSPSWSLRNAVNGTSSTIGALLLDGWTIDDIIDLAKRRTAISNMAQFGVTQRLDEQWQLATDLSLSNTSGLPESGTQLADGTTGVEGYVPATPSTGTAWTLSERASGTNVFSSNDLSTGSLSFSKSNTATAVSALLNSRFFLEDIWTLDTSLRLYWQKDKVGGRLYSTSPVIRAGYKWGSNLTLEGEGGLDWIKTETTGIQSSRTTRKYFSFGGRWDF